MGRSDEKVKEIGGLHHENLTTAKGESKVSGTARLLLPTSNPSITMPKN